MAKILTLQQIHDLRPQLTGVVLAGGVFDLLHSGHIDLLENAKKAGNTLVVHITSDKRVRQKKGPTRPIQPEMERAKIIAAIRYVDYVFIADVPHYYKEILDVLAPDVLFFGMDGLTEDTEEYLDSISWDRSQIQVLTGQKRHHTSGIVEKIQST